MRYELYMILQSPFLTRSEKYTSLDNLLEMLPVNASIHNSLSG